MTAFEEEIVQKLIDSNLITFYGYLSNNSLLSKFQSGFRPKHSTLSALIQMCDNLLKNMDSGQINCVVFLDVRKAFDSINHEILIDKMRNFFGVTGNQLRWFESYLNNMQSSTMSYKRTIIEPKKIICGVPQGSILGPLLFLLYINDMPDSLSHLTPSLYADDKNWAQR
jgi:retron-type reverse transcriptase